MHPQDLAHRVGDEGRPAGQALEDQDGQRVLVGPPIQWLAVQLLRRHVGGRPHRTPRLRQRHSLGGAESLGHAKITHHGASVVIHHDVRGLYIPVHDAPFVGIVERASYLLDDLESLHPAHGAVLLDPLHQGATRHEFHREPQECGRGPDPMNRDDVGMIQ